MSLVGTRPPTVDEWDKYELHHRARLATKPGLTGMWQVSGRSNDWLDVISITHNCIPKECYKAFEKMVNKLYEFLKIFKSDLQGIEIDKKENRDKWVCDLVMVYDSYKIHAEYESRGIEKIETAGIFTCGFSY